VPWIDRYVRRANLKESALWDAQPVKAEIEIAFPSVCATHELCSNGGFFPESIITAGTCRPGIWVCSKKWSQKYSQWFSESFKSNLPSPNIQCYYFLNDLLHHSEQLHGYMLRHMHDLAVAAFRWIIWQSINRSKWIFHQSLVYSADLSWTTCYQLLLIIISAQFTNKINYFGPLNFDAWGALLPAPPCYANITCMCRHIHFCTFWFVSYCLLRRRSRQREHLSASGLSVCSSVRLSVRLSPKCTQKNRFSQKLSRSELWSLFTTYRKSYMGFSKNPLLDP